jgi:hypothetical protein
MTRLSLSPLPLQPGTAGAKPVGLQPGQSVAASGAAPTNQEVLADEFVATAGENRRTPGEACALLLAATRGTSVPAAVRSDAGSDCDVAGADGIDAGSRRPWRHRSSCGCSWFW